MTSSNISTNDAAILLTLASKLNEVGECHGSAEVCLKKIQEFTEDAKKFTDIVKSGDVKKMINEADKLSDILSQNSIVGEDLIKAKDSIKKISGNVSETIEKLKNIDIEKLASDIKTGNIMDFYKNIKDLDVPATIETLKGSLAIIKQLPDLVKSAYAKFKSYYEKEWEPLLKSIEISFNNNEYIMKVNTVVEPAIRKAGIAAVENTLGKFGKWLDKKFGNDKKWEAKMQKLAEEKAAKDSDHKIIDSNNNHNDTDINFELHTSINETIVEN